MSTHNRYHPQSEMAHSEQHIKDQEFIHTHCQHLVSSHPKLSKECRITLHKLIQPYIVLPRVSSNELIKAGVKRYGQAVKGSGSGAKIARHQPDEEICVTLSDSDTDSSLSVPRTKTNPAILDNCDDESVTPAPAEEHQAHSPSVSSSLSRLERDVRETVCDLGHAVAGMISVEQQLLVTTKIFHPSLTLANWREDLLTTHRQMGLGQGGSNKTCQSIGLWLAKEYLATETTKNNFKWLANQQRHTYKAARKQLLAMTSRRRKLRTLLSPVFRGYSLPSHYSCQNCDFKSSHRTVRDSHFWYEHDRRNKLAGDLMTSILSLRPIAPKYVYQPQQVSPASSTNKVARKDKRVVVQKQRPCYNAGMVYGLPHGSCLSVLGDTDICNTPVGTIKVSTMRVVVPGVRNPCLIHHTIYREDVLREKNMKKVMHFMRESKLLAPDNIIHCLLLKACHVPHTKLIQQALYMLNHDSQQGQPANTTETPPQLGNGVSKTTPPPSQPATTSLSNLPQTSSNTTTTISNLTLTPSQAATGISNTTVTASLNSGKSGVLLAQTSNQSFLLQPIMPKVTSIPNTPLPPQQPNGCTPIAPVIPKSVVGTGHIIPWLLMPKSQQVPVESAVVVTSPKPVTPYPGLSVSTPPANLQTRGAHPLTVSVKYGQEAAEISQLVTLLPPEPHQTGTDLQATAKQPFTEIVSQLKTPLLYKVLGKN